MFFHRFTKQLDFPEEIKEEIFKDMTMYGYLLPGFTPILTRYICRKAGAYSVDATMASMRKYVPYDVKCFAKEHDRFDVPVQTPPS